MVSETEKHDAEQEDAQIRTAIDSDFNVVLSCSLPLDYLSMPAEDAITIGKSLVKMGKQAKRLRKTGYVTPSNGTMLQ